jgi:hypothetical protein
MLSKIIFIVIIFKITMTAQVTVQLQQPPPFLFKLEHLWKVTLINPTSETYKIYLFANAIETTQGEIVEATTAFFYLSPGIKVINPNELFPMDVQTKNSKYNGVIKNHNVVPAGEYDICVSAVDYETGTTLGIDCITTNSENISGIELIGPDDKIAILPGIDMASSEQGGTSYENSIPINGSLAVFNWLPVSGSDPSALITYGIKITEIYGMQSAYDAIHSNPAFYKEENIYSTIFRFPSAAREFSPGKKYAWQVTAYINGYSISKSEVREFAFGKSVSAFAIKRNIKINSAPTGLSEYLNSGGEKYFSKYSNGEKNNSNLSLSGSAKLETQAANREGYRSEVPEQFSNLEINPVITLFGLPFSSNMLISTQQQPAKQNINSFGLNFDIERIKGELKERLSEKAGEVISSEIAGLKKDYAEKMSLQEKLKESENSGNKAESDSLRNMILNLESLTGSTEELKSSIAQLENSDNYEENLSKFGLISGSEQLMMDIKTFGIGTSYPNYTPHTLNGVPISGINIELTPAFLYVAFAGSMNQRGIPEEAYKRNLFAGRIGAGKQEESHIHITGLYAKDDELSIATPLPNSSLTPKANYIFGLEGKLRFFENSLIIEGETAASMLTRDVRSADLDIDGMPPIVKNLMQPKVSSSFDYMYAAKTFINLEATNTKLTLSTKMIGPGYTSLGVPNLRSDYLGYEGKIDQRFMNNKISLSTSIKRQRDNLIDWKAYTTTTTSFNVNLGIRMPSLPSISVTYTPFFQKNDETDPLRAIDNKTNMISLVSSYNYKIMEFQSSTYFVLSFQESKTIAGINDFITDNYMITQTATFDLPVTFAASLGIIHMKPGGAYNKIGTFDFSALFPIFEMFQSIIGFRTAVEKDLGKKFGLYFGTSVNLLEKYSAELRLEKPTYTDWLTNNSYSDAIVRFSLQASL